MNDSDILNVLIIGCGNIAGDLDSNKLDSEQAPLTHAGAYTANQHFCIKGCVDISEDKSERFARRWGIPNAYTSIDQAIQAAIGYDVISICSPTGSHYEDLMACLLLSPKLVFCEKPVTSAVEDTLKIKTVYEQAGVLLAVNYLRRWDEHIIRLKKEIESNERGALRSIVGYYGKGISNNGSHLLDILGFLIGKMVIKHVGRADYDFFQDDPSVCVTLEAEHRVPVLLVPGARASDFSIFEIQLIFDSSMLLMLDGGLRWVERRASESEVFDGYRVLDSGTEYRGGYMSAMSQAVDNIWRTLVKGDVLNSSIDTSLVAQVLCEKISKAADQ